MKFLDIDGPVITFLTNVVDLFLLNLLCLICCIPIVTAGAAITAKYDVAMRMARKEAPTVFRPYFKAFRANFKVSTKVWLVQLALILILAADWYLQFRSVESAMTGPVLRILLIVVSVFILFLNMTVYPLIARYETGAINAVKSAMIFSLLNLLPLALTLALIGFILYLCYLFFTNFFPIIAVVGSVLVLYTHTSFLVRAFDKYEKKRDPVVKEQNEEEADQEERIFSDKPINQ